MTDAPQPSGRPADMPSLGTVLREWGRIGCVGFGGPPTHIKLLRELCVERRRWIDEHSFEDAIATCNLLPGPSSTQLAIYCAWRVRGRLGALAGGVAFIVPGLVVILALSVLFFGSPPTWVRAAGAGAGAAVGAVAVSAGLTLVPASWHRRVHALRWSVYLVLGGVAAAAAGPWLVLVLIACGLAELALRPARGRSGMTGATGAASWPVVLASGAGTVGTLLGVCWVALKVGMLSYGGGFVIVPLMQADAVGRYHWMTAGQFLNAVALGQITPGPVVQTVAVVGYAAAGLLGGMLAAVVAFAPSFVMVLSGAGRFEAIRTDDRARAFLAGAGPAAIGAILGAAVPLVRALSQSWQYAVLAAAALLMISLRRGPVLTLVLAAAGGILANAVGLTVPR